MGVAMALGRLRRVEGVLLMKMYNGAIELEFDEKKHVYRVGDQIVPGVTSILDILPKPWLAPWAVKIGAEAATELFNSYPSEASEDGTGDYVPLRLVSDGDWERIVKAFKGAHRQKKEAAADTGKMAHNWCEAWAIAQWKQVDPPPMPTHPEARAACETFLEWMMRHNVTIIEAERRILSKLYWYAGTVDIIAWVDGELSVLDIKTSSRISYSMHMQTAAYTQAYEEETGKIIQRRGIIRLPKDGEPFEYRESSDPEDLRAFVGLIPIYHYTKRKEKEK